MVKNFRALQKAWYIQALLKASCIFARMLVAKTTSIATWLQPRVNIFVPAISCSFKNNHDHCVIGNLPATSYYRRLKFASSMQELSPEAHNPWSESPFGASSRCALRSWIWASSTAVKRFPHVSHEYISMASVDSVLDMSYMPAHRLYTLASHSA